MAKRGRGGAKQTPYWIIENGFVPLDAWALEAAVLGLAGALGPERAEEFAAIVEMLELHDHVWAARQTLRQRRAA